ncbi:large membrane associated channel [Cryptosporidium felis]|nr:large membrane associated channel [Cryptosporidium felis]
MARLSKISFCFRGLVLNTVIGILLLNIPVIKGEMMAKNSNLHHGMYNGNKEGLLKQHKMIGEFLECTYIEHLNPYSSVNATVITAGTGWDRSESRVISMETLDSPEKILKILECQKNLLRNWNSDTNRSLKENLFSVIDVKSWREKIRSNSLSLESDRILSILENKNSSPFSKVKEAVIAFEKYVNELIDAYSDFEKSRKRLENNSNEEEIKIRAHVAVTKLGQRENKALVNFTKVVRGNSEEARETKRLMERLLPLLSSEQCANRIMKALELVQICFFLLNGLNILSVFEEQRMSNRFKREMNRRFRSSLSKIEDKTQSLYPKFSKAPNFKEVTKFLMKTVINPADLQKEKQIETKMIGEFDQIVSDFGVRCPYVLTTFIRSGRTASFAQREDLFDQSAVKNCRLAWNEISSYFYREGQILPSAAIRQALKKALNKHHNSVYVWPRKANELYQNIIVQSKFEDNFDTTNEQRFISTCAETVQNEIGIDSFHGVSLDEIVIICFNLFNLLELFTEKYNYGFPEKKGQNGQPIRATKKNVSIKTLPGKLKAGALDIAISQTLAGIIDFPPFKANDLDRAVIGVLAENFMETCSLRLEAVLGKATKYRLMNPQTVCGEALTILKNYNTMSQNPETTKNSMDIFEIFNIIDFSEILNKIQGPEKSDILEHLNSLRSRVSNQQKSIHSGENKEIEISPINWLDATKAYDLVQKMHLDWMEQMKNDPRYKGLTDLELKVNSPWYKQLRLWNELIKPELPQIRYAASYLNNRPSRFPLISGDKRGKHKRIVPLEELLEEDIDPKYRARYSLVENGPYEYQDFHYEDVQEYGNSIKESEIEPGIKKSKYHVRGKKYIKYRDREYEDNDSRIRNYHEKIENLIHNHEISVIPTKVHPKIYVKHQNINFAFGATGEFSIENGCEGEELPKLWGQRATILHENMLNIFRQIKYMKKFGPGHFISIDDLCYILERDFKVKRNYFGDISKVNLIDCVKWFSDYLSKLWPPFTMDSLRGDIKGLCWESGFRGWL